MNKKYFSEILVNFKKLNLINEIETNEVLNLFTEFFPYSESLKIAESIHVHIKVDDTALLPHDKILQLGGNPQNQKSGYIKYAFSAGLNMIFSSIKVSEEDRLPLNFKIKKPMMDHIGIDIRQENTMTRKVFDALACISKKAVWNQISQGGKGKAVYCCHVEVAEKLWVYPPLSSFWTRPIEFAYGELKLNDLAMGCDLRPSAPLFL